MNFFHFEDTFNRAIDIKISEICKLTTSGQIEELICNLKQHINGFDYNNIVEISNPSHVKMRLIVEIVQKGNRITKNLFLEFLNEYHPQVYEFISGYISDRNVSNANPEMNSAGYECSFTYAPMPRLSMRNDCDVASHLQNTTLSDTPREIYSHIINNITDVHNSITRSDPLSCLNDFKNSIIDLFGSLNQKEYSDFLQWIHDCQFIERGTLSRCVDINDVIYELEKREMLNAFISYPSYPDTLDYNDIHQKFHRIPKYKCDKCKKKILKIF